MKSLWWVFLVPVLVLAGCGGDAAEGEPTPAAEPPSPRALSPTPEPTSTPEPTPAPFTPTPTLPAASENPILPTGPVSLDEPTVGSISAKKLARAGIRTNVIRGLTLTAPLKTVLERKILSTDRVSRSHSRGVREAQGQDRGRPTAV